MRGSGLYLYVLLSLLLLFTAHNVFAVEQSRGGPIDEPVIDRVIVGIEDFKLIALSDNDVVFEFPVAVGADTGSTPTGRYQTVSRLKNPWYTPDDGEAIEPGSPENPIGSRWIGISKPDYGLHGTNEPSSIGDRASKGCIRLRNDQIDKLYRHLPKGTPVIIQDHLNFNSDGILTANKSEEGLDRSEG